MKTNFAFLFLSALIVSALVYLSFGPIAPASAQTRGAAARPDDGQLADMIERFTDRSGANLFETPMPDGKGVSVDLNDTFQNLMLGRIGAAQEPVAACVTSLAEANDFFGRDLRTGTKIASHYPDPTDVDSIASRHGMSASEFRFYLDLIEAAAVRRAANPNSATITILNADSPGEGFNDTTPMTPEGGNSGTTLGQQRLNLFTFAANVWGAFLDSGTATVVNSKFDPLTPCTTSGGVLGSAGATSVSRDFASAPAPGTWYHRALVNKLEGSDTNGATAEINATFNSSVDTGCLGSGSRFYYGLDNTTPSLRINLLVVLLHEMGHGLGFSSFANGSTGALFNGFPDAYTRYMFDATTGKHWNEMTDAERVTSALNNNNVYWDGPNVVAASSFLTSGRDPSGRVALYTPATFAPGSSVSHFGTINTPNLLMEPNINSGLPLDLDLTKQQMRDIGWYRDTNGDRVPDTILNITPSGASVGVGTSVNITWTNGGGFDRNVTIELSTDGGSTYPTTIASNIANAGSFSWTVPNLPTATARIRVREAGFLAPVGASSTNFTIGASTAVHHALFDFDGDGRTDASVYRPSNNVWYLLRGTAGFAAYQFGANGDQLVPADYTGDGKTDVAIWRPAVGTWFILRSEDLTVTGGGFGLSGDIPIPGDFDGDGKADLAVYRPGAQSVFYIQGSSTGFQAISFGLAEDRPTLGDFDGDGKTDIAVYRPSQGVWYRINSSNGTFYAAQFGQAGDKIVPADYTGDGKTDLAVWRESTGVWFILRSEDNSVFGGGFGIAGDVPSPGDYDGDGKADFAVYRSGSQGIFYVLGTTNGFQVIPWGIAGDRPVPSLRNL